MNPPYESAVRETQRMADQIVAALPNVLVALVLLLVFYIAGRLAAKTVRVLSNRVHESAGLAVLLARLVYVGIMTLGVLVAIAVIFPTFAARDLVQVLGIGGIAAGFAFKDIIQNFLAGILLLASRPFRIGDQIRVEGVEGTVEEIQTRATMIRTFDNQRIVVPNATIFTNNVTVITAYETRRIDYDVGIGYGDDIDEAKRIMLDVMRSVEGVAADPPPDVLVWGLDESWVTLRIRWWTTPVKMNVVEVRDRVLTEVKRALDEAGIDLPYPTHVTLFHDQTEESDGDRSRQREGWPAGRGEVPAARASRVLDLLRDSRRA
jgi:small conductance mechanosensitive channel